MAGVIIEKLVKSFKGAEVIHAIDAAIEDGEFVVVVGPSGCGKSTLLRLIAGLETASSGFIHMNGRCVNDVAPKDRNIAMVFQNYALYPHMTVFNNMAYGLKLQKMAKSEIRARVDDAAKLLQLENLLTRKPAALSGGQRQRVAMGRAIVRHPDVFLFDEPLSNLDAKLRQSMRVELKKLHDTLKTTMIYVTHDQVEAMTLADRIMVMQQGRIQEMGTPDQLYKQPATLFTAKFIGSPEINIFPAHPQARGVAFDFSGQVFPARVSRDNGNRELLCGVRPEHIRLFDPDCPEPGSDISTPARIDLVENLGADTLCYLTLDRHPGYVVAKTGRPPGNKARVTLGFSLAQALFFDARSRRRVLL